MIRGLTRALCAAMSLLALSGCFDSGHTAASAPAATTAHFPGARPTRLPVTTAVSVRSIPVGYGAYDVAAGSGGVWVAVSHGLTRLNTLGRVTGRVPLDNSMEWTNVSAGPGGVWYLEGNGTTHTAVVGEISPTTLRVTRVLAVGGLHGGTAYENVAGAKDGVCVGVLTEQATTPVRCVGTGTGNGVINLPRVGTTRFPGVAMVTDGQRRVVVGGGAVRQVDLATGKVLTTPIPAGAVVSAVATDGPRVWAVVVHLHHPTELWGMTGASVVRRIRLPMFFVGGMAARDGRVWLLSGRSVYAVTPAGRARVVAHVPPRSGALAASSTALWTVEYQAGTVTRIGRATG